MLGHHHNANGSAYRLVLGQSLTKAGLGVGVDILVLTPFHHTLEDRHQTLQAFLSEGQLLQGTGTSQQGI